MGRLSILTAALTFAAGAPAALAADLYAPPPAAVYMDPAPAISWTGLYIGLHGGWGWGDADARYAGDTDLNEDCPFDPPFGPAGEVGCAVGANLEGAFVGVQGGYNFVFGNGLMLGVEGDYAVASINGSGDGGTGFYATHVDYEIDQLASIRGRLGWAMGRWLPFVTAGWGWAHADRTIFNPSLPDPTTRTASNWHDGWTAGLGLEYAINDRWSVKGEYRYYDLGTENYSLPTLPGDGTDVDLSLHTVSFGVNYGF